MNFSFSFINIYDNLDVLWFGLLSTLEFTLICVVLGVLLGFVVALMRLSPNKTVRWIGTAYVEFFRGTPVLIQLFWVFFCLPIILGVELSNFTSAIIALTLFMGAITSETFRSSLQGIPKEELEACTALGLSRWQQVRYIVFPQALFMAIPTLLSNSISLFKESSLVSAVGMADLMYLGQNLSNSTARPVEFLTAVAVIYFIIAFPLTQMVTKLEQTMLLKMAK